jgi:cyclophilin family peptidyl-prolyl cis-trans isomerase
MRLTRSTVILGSVLFGIVLWAALALMHVKATPSLHAPAAAGAGSAYQNVDWIKEGPTLAPQLTAGPFDLHRRYRSMEGPYVSAKFRVGDLVASSTADLPEDRVRFVEKNAPPPSTASANGVMAISGDVEMPKGLKDTSKEPRQLYWLKGFKLEVLDEKGNVTPTAEFICHLNLDIDAAKRNKVFPFGERTTYERLLTITQGQSEVHFPDGYAFPVASDEEWRVAFQAANRTTDEHRRVKHRATFYFVKDADLTYPVTAMYVRTPFVGVVVDRAYKTAINIDHKKHPSCEVMMRGVNAPNSTNGGTFTDSTGRVVSGHWVVPPGKHEYLTVVNDQDPGFAQKDRTMRYGWVHIHPCCQTAFLQECTGKEKQQLAAANITTEMKGNGLELTHIETLGKEGGVPLHKGGHYEIGAVYDNTTSGALDSMVTLGMFFDDVDFKRPDWSLPGYHEEKPFCGVTSCKFVPKHQAAAGAASASADPNAPALFDPKKDGPVLNAPTRITIKTSNGMLHATLNPAYAPNSATQIYKLLTSGVYNNTPFIRYDPDFVLQLAVADQKEAGQPALTDAQKKLIRTLPLEAEAQREKKVHHARYALSMARNDDDENSAQTSFSILLRESPHLDGKYTIIGFLDEDATTNATVEKMLAAFPKKHPVILGCSK